MRGLAFACVLICGLVLHTSFARAAAGTVTLLGVSGIGGERLADSLEQDLAELYEVVPAEVYRSAAERSGRRSASPEDVSSVCRSLRIDALVAGSITSGADGRQLVIVVREGLSGRVVSRTRYELSTRTLPRQQVTRELMKTLDGLQRVPRRGVVSAPRPAPQLEPVDAAAEPQIELAAPSSAPKQASEPVFRGFFAGAGPGLMSRTLGFDVRSAPGYAGGTVATVQVEGGVFPLALSRELADAHPILASFGLLGSYEYAFDFTSSTPSGASATGRASRWSALLVGRIPLGHAARGGTLTIETGYERVSWHSRSVSTVGVPDVTYEMFDGGLGWDRALGTRYLELGVRLAAEGVLDGGKLMSSAEYGRGSGWGLDIGAGLTARPVSWLWLRLGARYTPLYLTFHGEGARLAHGASDRFVDGTLEVGFAL